MPLLEKGNKCQIKTSLLSELDSEDVSFEYNPLVDFKSSRPLTKFKFLGSFLQK